METLQESTYTVTQEYDETLMICTAWDTSDPMAETVIHRVFLDAYNIGLDDSFFCKSDRHGNILPDTIRKAENFNKRFQL